MLELSDMWMGGLLGSKSYQRKAILGLWGTAENQVFCDDPTEEMSESFTCITKCKGRFRLGRDTSSMGDE